MAKGNRTRRLQGAARTKSGQLSRSKAALAARASGQAADTMSTATAQRRKHFGLKGTQASSPLAGSVLGRLLLNGRSGAAAGLNTCQYQAGLWLADAYNELAGALDSPGWHQMKAPTGGLPPADPVLARRAVRAKLKWDCICAALDQAGAAHGDARLKQLVLNCVFADSAPTNAAALQLLKLGLNTLDHLKAARF